MGDKDAGKKTILFNNTKKETHNPNSGFKKLFRRLRSNFKVLTNKDEILKDRLEEADMAIFGGPREPFSDVEFDEMKQWLHSGGRALVLLADGGEKVGGSNINAFIRDYGISVNNDSVMRSAYYKYLHPKEVFISEGILVPDLIRKKNSSVISGNKKAQATKQDSQRPLSKEATETEKLLFVYPYGATLNVQKPGRSLLSSGPISYPINRSIAGTWESETVAEHASRRGRLVVIGSTEIFGDDWLDKEENVKLCDTLFSWLMDEVELDMNSDRQDADIQHEYTPVPHIEALSQNLKPCLQGMDDLPKDFTKLFDTSLFAFDTSLIPKVVNLYKLMGVPHEALTLIPPQFECPLPKLAPATFPPAMREPMAPALDQFDLDEHFAKENIRLSQLTNKCSNGEEDLEYYIAESGEILGVTKDLPFGERSAKHILFHIFKQVVDFKKQDGGSDDPVVAVNAEEYNENSLDGYAETVEAIPVKALHLAHVDLAPMKEVAGKAKLAALDSSMQIGGLAIGGDTKDEK